MTAIIEARVIDEKGNPVKRARIDIDRKQVWGWWEHKPKPEELIAGELEEKELYGDGYNVITTEEGYCKLALPDDEYRLRAAKSEWLNEDSKQDWSEFQETTGGEELIFTIYRFWIVVTCKVRDEKGNVIKDARVDIDFAELRGSYYDWRNFSRGDVIKGTLETGKFFGDPYNIIVNDDGEAVFFVWKRGTRKIEDWTRNLPNWCRCRAGAEEFLNEKDKKDWCEFKTHEIKIDDTEVHFDLTLYSQTLEVETFVRDQCGREIQEARIDVDVNYHWDPRWYEYDKLKPEDVLIGTIDPSELYDDTHNIKSDEHGHAKFVIPKYVDGKKVEYYGFRAAHAKYENEKRKWDWGDRKEFKIVKEKGEIKQDMELNKPCDWSDPCTYPKCIPGLPWEVWVIVGTATVAGAAVGSYALWKSLAKKI